ncbi:MAG: hypothetical protein RLZZ574_725 [Cyanobacteriota bacterium]|jgi:predicted dinucleotide-binding enzyme
MNVDRNHYDLIIIGTGAGGGTLARQLAPTGKQILNPSQLEIIPNQQSATNQECKRLAIAYAMQVIIPFIYL